MYKSRVCGSKGEARAWSDAVEAQFKTAADGGLVLGMLVRDAFHQVCAGGITWQERGAVGAAAAEQVG
ncbi:MAG: hypothetical protein AAF669_03360 [Pseudomonadota bacterium]